MRFTNRQGLSVLSFALVFVLLFLAVDKILFVDKCIPDTWLRLRREKTVPQVLIMGNSHAFCSFAPDILNDALGVDAAVLGSSGIGSAGTTDSFEAVLRVGAPEVLVVELNAYLQPYNEASLYHKANTLDNINGMPHLFSRVKSAWHEMGFESIPQGAFQLLRADRMWLRWSGEAEINYASNGSALMNYHADGVYDAQIAQNRALPYQQNLKRIQPDEQNEREFRRLMSLAQQHGVQVVLVKTPLVSTSQHASNMIVTYAAIAAEYDDVLLGVRDFHFDIAKLQLVLEDFYDETHFSRSGAARFTIGFAKWLGELIGTPPDFDRCFAYGGEHIQPAGDGQWLYTMDTVGAGIECRFVRMVDGREEVVQDWGEQSSAILPIDPRNANEVTFQFRRGERLASYSFMTANACVFK